MWEREGKKEKRRRGRGEETDRTRRRAGGGRRESLPCGKRSDAMAKGPLIHSSRAPLSWPWVVWAGSSGSAQGLYGHSWVLRQPASWALPPLLPAQLATWVSASFCWPGEDLYRIQPEIRGHSG